jgi:hypothetical protein
MPLVCRGLETAWQLTENACIICLHDTDDAPLVEVRLLPKVPLRVCPLPCAAVLCVQCCFGRPSAA